MSIKTKLARKAVSSTAKHTAHGTASKLKRNPLRTSTLLALGAALGVAVGLLLGRKTAGSGAPDFAESPAPEVEATQPIVPTTPVNAASVSIPSS